MWPGKGCRPTDKKAMTLDWTALTYRGWFGGTRFTENKGLDPGMAAAFSGSVGGAYSYRRYRVKSKESTMPLIALGRLASMD
jgi:hypothetical protein